MARDFRTNGETLALVKLGAHIIPTPLGAANGGSALFELGLASEAISVTPRYVHQDVVPDDFGPNIPAEVLWMLSDLDIRIPFIHYDQDVLEACWIESMGANGGTFPLGTLPPAGLPLAGYTQLQASGNHFMSLNLTSPVLGRPWRFRACYMTGPPVQIPLGTDTTVALTNWRAIPYRAPTLGTIVSGFSPYTEITSSGVPLFDRTLDT